MMQISDREWLWTYDKFHKERYEHYIKSGVSAAEAIDQAFQETVDLEFHPYSPIQCPINQRVMTEWGEHFQKMLEAEIHIAIINADTISPEVGIIKVKYGWLLKEFPQWLIDNGHYDYFHEIPDDKEELLEHFLFVYCDYSPNDLHWQCVPADTQFKRLTIKDFQK
ncbi:MAG: hypothetical protein HDS14_02985 [Bacteroides sp.]|nr:hypothetical protein [Bacteroides sp.]